MCVGGVGLGRRGLVLGLWRKFVQQDICTCKTSAGKLEREGLDITVRLSLLLSTTESFLPRKELECCDCCWDTFLPIDVRR